MVRRSSRVALVFFACAVLLWPQRRSDPDPQALIEQSRRKALEYSKSLPDFVCTELVNRYVDRRMRNQWTLSDKLTVKLSYFQQKEDHKLLLVNGQPSDQDYTSLVGAVGEGEFGGTLESIFDPHSRTEFRWESWKTVHKRRAAVYNYSVARENSRYLLVAGVVGAEHRAVVGYHGSIEIDAESGEVLHFTYQADHIPKILELDYSTSSVDYDLAAVGGRDYLLPMHAETIMRSGSMAMWNEVEFKEYRKFSSDSNITFDPGK